MAQLPYGPFDANQVEPDTGIAADPAFTGWHPMMFTESEMKPTKDGKGEYLQLVAEVTAGPFKGRKLWARFNLINASQQAVEIAFKQLSSVCRATGIMLVADSQQLHNRQFEGNVEFEPAEGKYKAKNNLVGYRPISGGAPAVHAPAHTPAPAAAPATSAPPPWARSKTAA